MARREWHSLAFDMWTVGAQASAVISLRLARLCACDGAAMVEAHHMITEKIQAAVALPFHTLRGDLGTSLIRVTEFSLGHYGKAIRANRKRLSTSPRRKGRRKPRLRTF